LRRAGIVKNPDVDPEYASRLVAVLEKHDVEVVGSAEVSYDTHDTQDPQDPQDPQDTHDTESPVDGAADVIFVLGGDGTMLRASKTHPGKVLLGVNLGTVGFMSGMSPENIEPGVEQVLDGALHVQEYRLLEIESGGERRLAVNDAVLLKKRPHQIASVEVSVGGERLASYQCDGLIAATPLGSTAYALSAGGPIISGDVPCYTLVPIAPHSLVSRPMVLGGEQRTELTLNTRGALLSLDGGEPYELEPESTVRVGLSEESIKIGRTDEWSWWRAVRRTFL
jgi:NAD+ kinase